MSDTTDTDAIAVGFDSEVETVAPEPVETPDTESKAVETEKVETPDAEETEEPDAEEETPASEEPEAEEETDTESEDEPQEEDAKEKARQAYLARQEDKRKKDEEVAKELEEYAQDDDPVQEKLKRLEVEQYRNRVENNTEKLKNGYDKAIASIDLFRDPNPVIREALGDAIDEFQARYVQVDRYGNPVEVTGDLTQFLQTKAGLIQKLAQIGARQQSAGKAKSQAATTPVPSKAAPQPKSNPIMDGFDSYTN